MTNGDPHLFKKVNSLRDYSLYAHKQYHTAWVTGQKPANAARNIAMEFMTPKQLLKFSIECVVCAIRKAIK